MLRNRLLPLLTLFGLLLAGCGPKMTMDTEVRTNPEGASVVINGLEKPYPTPFKHTFDFTTATEYRLTITKDGFFEEEYVVDRNNPGLKEGEITINLTASPLWQATTFSPATNNWIQVLVGPDIDAKTAWQIMIDAVIKRSSNIKELNYESGYLQTKYTVKKFETKNGEFLLRCQLIATLVSSEPLIYRIKDVAEWSGNGVQWHPYNRIFTEHNEMVTEIQDRLGSY